MDEVEELRVRGLEEDGVQLGGLEVNAEGRHEAEEVVFKRFGEGVGNAVPNLLDSCIDGDEEAGVGNAVGPNLLEPGVGVDNAIIPNLLGDMERAMPWPERGPRLMELPIEVERERDEGLELAAISSTFSDTSQELNEQDGELF